MTQAVPGDDPLRIGSHVFSSRLIVGTGKYRDFAETKHAVLGEQTTPGDLELRVGCGRAVELLVAARQGLQNEVPRRLPLRASEMPQPAVKLIGRAVRAASRDRAPARRTSRSAGRPGTAEIACGM